MSLVACGSIHQGHESFSSQSRGKQCSFMCLSVLLKAQTIPVFEWNTARIDSLLNQGNTMYLNDFENDDIPHEGFLSLNHLPSVVRLPEHHQSKSKSPVIVTNIDLPIVEPIEAR